VSLQADGPDRRVARTRGGLSLLTDDGFPVIAKNLARTDGETP
jgi:hypothetical protein